MATADTAALRDRATAPPGRIILAQGCEIDCDPTRRPIPIRRPDPIPTRPPDPPAGTRPAGWARPEPEVPGPVIIPVLLPPPSEPPPAGFLGLSDNNTGAIAAQLREAASTCAGGWLPREYRLDCLRRYYLDLARSLPDTGDYKPVKQALKSGADRLGAIVEANADPEKPRLRVPKRGKPDAARTPP